MTEDEAKTKRCCGPEGCGFVGNDKERYCIGSQCMAWRWIKIDRDYKFGPADDEGKMKVLSSPITEYGYCGLAGKP